MHCNCQRLHRSRPLLFSALYRRMITVYCLSLRPFSLSLAREPNTEAPHVFRSAGRVQAVRVFVSPSLSCYLSLSPCLSLSLSLSLSPSLSLPLSLSLSHCISLFVITPPHCQYKSAIVSPPTLNLQLACLPLSPSLPPSPQPP